MSKSAKTLKAEFEKAEKAAIEASNKYDADRQEQRAKVQEANNKAAAAQKAWLDAEVRESLKDRPDGEAVAVSLGINLDS
jgi:hypothetical protein